MYSTPICCLNIQDDGRRKPIPATDPMKRAARFRAAAKSKDKKGLKSGKAGSEKKQPKKTPTSAAAAPPHAHPSPSSSSSSAAASSSSASGVSAAESGAAGPHSNAALSSQSQALVAAYSAAAEAGEPLCLLRARLARKRKLATVVCPLPS